MNEAISVHVIQLPNRNNFYLRYLNPVTNRQEARSTGKTKRRNAEREAAKWEAELREGRYQATSNPPWQEFRERYTEEVLDSLAENTFRTVSSTFNSIETILNPQRIRDLTAARISHFQSQLRKPYTRGQGDKKRTVRRSEATIRTYLAHLRAALRWGKSVNMLNSVSTIKMPKRAKDAKAMKGRPIAGEEFERMLDKVAKVVGDDAAPSWKHYLRGLWFSGLRLAESLDLYWDRGDRLRVDLSGKHPALRIKAHGKLECRRF